MCVFFWEELCSVFVGVCSLENPLPSRSLGFHSDDEGGIPV